MIAGMSFLAMLAVLQTAEEICPSPPVLTDTHAVCIAKRSTERKPMTWKVRYTVSERGDFWLVSYAPEGSVRGGAGMMKIERLTGKVTFLEGQR